MKKDEKEKEELNLKFISFRKNQDEFYKNTINEKNITLYQNKQLKEEI